MNRTLLLVNLTGLVIGASYGLHGPVLPLFAAGEIGATYSELGLIGLASFAPYMFVPLLVGALLGRFDNARLLAAGAALNAASVYLLSVAQTVPEVAAARVLTGVAHAFFWPPCESIISAESHGRDRVRNVSWFTMFFVIGFMAGPLVGTALLEGLDATYRALFQVTAFMLATAVAGALLMRARAVPGGRGMAPLRQLAAIARFPEVLVLLVFCTACFGTVLTVYPAYLSERGMGDSEILYLYFGFGLVRVAALALGGRLAGRTGPTLVAATAAVSAGLAVSAFGGSFAAFAAALVLMGFGFSVFFPLTLEIILSRTGGAVPGGMIGAYETVFGIGWAVGPTAAGPMAQSLGSSSPYLAFCIAGVCVTAMAAARMRRLEPLRRG